MGAAGNSICHKDIRPYGHIAEAALFGITVEADAHGRTRIGRGMGQKNKLHLKKVALQ